ncbi:MAG: YqaJ viral recombinase family protein [Candidatus Phytoplasma stylosanthis]|uniref:lambda-exonuclease family protein n=1 Tax=Candidatus Phytoplasma stylosanthis TaxID=2798314 RepID=UPI00293B0399|nr:YqaJ viral recombinase family protein [Candidatus Phytoplasma stylosanthis]MDV3170831.1 YqaJ viral recombinase family protein [Candidatus Phytoplasma stylosanthis]
MKKIDLKQNSWAWFKHRQHYINASEIGTIMGLNPYETKEELIKKKLFKKPFVTNEAMEHGKKTEPKANLFFSVLNKKNYEPAVFIKDLFSASLDGYHAPSQTMLEIKCPLEKGNSWQEFIQKKIVPPYYWAQIQCGLYCSEAKLAYFLVYFQETDYYLAKITLDLNFIVQMKKERLAFKALLTHYRTLFEKKEEKQEK